MASSHRWQQGVPDRSRVLVSSTSASRPSHSLDTSELDSDDIPSLSATLSTLRVETPQTYISCTMAATERSTLDHLSIILSG